MSAAENKFTFFFKLTFQIVGGGKKRKISFNKETEMRTNNGRGPKCADKSIITHKRVVEETLRLFNAVKREG